MMGKLLTIGDGFKTMGSAIFWKQSFKWDVDAEKIMHRVLILDPRESATAHSPLRGNVRRIGLQQRFS